MYWAMAAAFECDIDHIHIHHDGMIGTQEYIVSTDSTYATIAILSLILRIRFFIRILL